MDFLYYLFNLILQFITLIILNNPCILQGTLVQSNCKPRLTKKGALNYA